MPAALPPVTDCGCSTTSSSSTPSTGTCCPTPTGLNNPNFDGVVPTDTTIWSEFWQLTDLVSGPVAQVWYWNPNLLAWQ